MAPSPDIILFDFNKNSSTRVEMAFMLKKATQSILSKLPKVYKKHLPGLHSAFCVKSYHISKLAYETVS